MWAQEWALTAGSLVDRVLVETGPDLRVLAVGDDSGVRARMQVPPTRYLDHSVREDLADALWLRAGSPGRCQYLLLRRGWPGPHDEDHRWWAACSRVWRGRDLRARFLVVTPHGWHVP